MTSFDAAPFAAACIPAASADNEAERVAIATRMFTDLETVLADGGAVEGELICDVLQFVAKSASFLWVALYRSSSSRSLSISIVLPIRTAKSSFRRWAPGRHYLC